MVYKGCGPLVVPSPTVQHPGEPHMPSVSKSVPSLNFQNNSKSRLRLVGTGLVDNQNVVVVYKHLDTVLIRWTGKLKNVKSDGTRGTARLTAEFPVAPATTTDEKGEKKVKETGSEQVSVTIESEAPVDIPVDLYDEP
jgi:hypothetical protein